MFKFTLLFIFSSIAVAQYQHRYGQEGRNVKPFYFSENWQEPEINNSTTPKTINVPVFRQASAPILEIVGDASSSADFFIVLKENVYKVKLTVQLDRDNNLQFVQPPPSSQSSSSHTTFSATTTTTTTLRTTITTTTNPTTTTTKQIPTTTTTKQPETTIPETTTIFEDLTSTVDESTSETPRQKKSYFTIKDAVQAFKDDLFEKEQQIGGAFESADVFYRHFTLNYGKRVIQIRCGYYVDSIARDLNIYCLQWKKGLTIGLQNTSVYHLGERASLMEANTTDADIDEEEDYDENEPLEVMDLRAYSHDLKQNIHMN